MVCVHEPGIDQDAGDSVLNKICSSLLFLDTDMNTVIECMVFYVVITLRVKVGRVGKHKEFHSREDTQRQSALEDVGAETEPLGWLDIQCSSQGQQQGTRYEEPAVFKDQQGNQPDQDRLGKRERRRYQDKVFNTCQGIWLFLLRFV